MMRKGIESKGSFAGKTALRNAPMPARIDVDELVPGRRPLDQQLGRSSSRRIDDRPLRVGVSDSRAAGPDHPSCNVISILSPTAVPVSASSATREFQYRRAC